MAQNLNAFANAYNSLAQINQNDAQQAAGKMLAGGDALGATNALYRAGDIQGAQQVQQYTDTQRVQHAQAAQRIASGIRKAVATGNYTPAQAYDLAVQSAPQLGVDPAELTKMRPAFDKDPQGFLDMVDQQAKRALEIVNRGNGGYDVVDKGTGETVRSVEGYAKPEVIGGYVYLPQRGQTPQLATGINPNAPEPAVNAAAPTTANAPRGVRNNNPLNLSNLGGGQTWNGQTGSDGQYAVFSTPEAGMAAADRNLQTYATKHGLNTIAGVVGRWAPPNENNTQSYIATVARDLGVDANQPLNLADAGVRQRLLQSMAKVELGQPAPVSSLQGSAEGDQIAEGPQIPGYRLIGPAKAGGASGDGKWEVYTDPKTNTQFRYNAATHEATTLDGSPYTPGALAKLNGGGSPRSAAGLFLQRFIAENPSATADDVSQANARFNMAKAATTAFGTGKQGQTINSLNVSIDHLSTLSDLSSALDNGDVQLLNRARQIWMAQTGNAAPANFEAAKQMVADEIVKGIVGSGGGVADREKAQAAINNASSPQQLAGVIDTYKHLLAGQLNGLRLQYKNTTGRDDFESKLLPETRTQLEGLTPQTSSQSNGPAGSTWSRLTPAQRQTAMQYRNSKAPAGSQGNPNTVTSQAEFNGLPVGAWFINPADGQVMRKTH